ncbi:hypothetical protein FEI14_12720 [Lacticaseibacillus zeae]|uniref:Malolactic regulator n=1 Tax=Lacticaseibacillus zeae TaxID=57037 RepID=A0A5R8LPM9_LACZE|nr:hypothetical protein FEI14_12720 [Lacticaseibacillus zeae]
MWDYFCAETRSLAQKSTCKDLERNGQRSAITPKDSYTSASNRASSRSCSESRRLLCRAILL